MARPKKKSALVDGFQELVETIRTIDKKLNELLKQKKSAVKGKRGRPAGSKNKSAASGGKRGRPKGSKNKPKVV
jgi:hypothetical protein